MTEKFGRLQLISFVAIKTGHCESQNCLRIRTLEVVSRHNRPVNFYEGVFASHQHHGQESVRGWTML